MGRTWAERFVGELRPSGILRTCPYSSHSPQLPKLHQLRPLRGARRVVNVRELPYVIPDDMPSNRRTEEGGENRGWLTKRSFSGRRGSLGESGARPTKNEEVREH